MRILHVDETFHPAFGYQCNPLAKFQAKQGNDVFIVTVEAKHIYPVYHEFGDYGGNLPAQDAEYERVTGVKIIRVHARGYVARRLIYRYSELFAAIESINPDVILVHCLETLTALRVLIKFSGKYPLAFDSHMLTMASRNPFASIYESLFRKIITPRIVSGGYPVIKTQNDDYVSEKLGIPKKQTRFISFGTDTDLFCPKREKRAGFLKANGFSSDCLVVVSTGKLSEPKGGKFFAHSIEKKICARKKIVFVIVANFEGDYESHVKEVLDRSENEIVFFPVQDYTSLPWFYQIGDVCIFPKQCSMSFYDAQACGLPVISEENNINSERNSHGNGLCFSPGSIDALRDAIAYMADLDDDKLAKMSSAARAYILGDFSYESIAMQYTEALYQACDNHVCSANER